MIIRWRGLRHVDGEMVRKIACVMVYNRMPAVGSQRLWTNLGGKNNVGMKSFTCRVGVM
jgi:hypothetical protein